MFNDVESHVERVSSNVQFSHQEALLYVFEDNEAVIKMILKGRSPTMRHVSRTHRVALDWLFDRYQFGSKNPNQVHRHQKQTCRHSNQGKFHAWWMDSSCYVCATCQTFQFYSLFWRDDKKNFKKILREETSHSKSARPMMSLYCKGCPRTLSSSASQSPGKKSYGKSEILGVRKLRKMIELGQTRCRLWPQVTQSDYAPRTNNLLKARTQQLCSRVGRWRSLVFSRVESW